MGDANNPVVEIHTNKGTMKLELFENDVPNTVHNFTGLIKKGFYDGLKFHRVIKHFMVQGGCPEGTGVGGPGYTIKCEIGPHKHQRGSLSMAHRGKDTGGSQFFICHDPQPHLDGKHTVFGKVIEGLEVLDAIEQGDRMESLKVVESVAS